MRACDIRQSLNDKFEQSHATTLDKPSEASAFAGVLLALLGIADLTAASLEELVALQYWLSNVPVRLTFLFGLTGYVYVPEIWEARSMTQILLHCQHSMPTFKTLADCIFHFQLPVQGGWHVWT